MKILENGTFTGERALFKSRDLVINNSTFKDGESPLKESKNVVINNSSFEWKYPLWYGENFEVNNSTFKVMSRSGIWYTKNIKLKNCLVEAPKEFRRASFITIEDTEFLDAKETLWSCDHINMKNVKSKGDYLLKDSSDVVIENLILDGNYILDGGKNIVVKNSILNSKDSFWNCENVEVYDSVIRGEYFGWNSKNVKLVNCTIESEQGFCYMENLVMENCKLENTNLAFEYSTINCEINSRIDSVKNIISGRLVCEGIDELIMDKNEIDPSKTEIIIKG